MVKMKQIKKRGHCKCRYIGPSFQLGKIASFSTPIGKKAP